MRPALAIALLGLAFAAAALLLDAEPLWVPAVALCALGGGSVAWLRLGCRGLRIERTLSARQVVEGEPLSVVLELLGGGRVPRPPALVVDALLRGGAPLAAGRGRARVRIDVRFERRGRRTLPPPRVRLADPLALATREIAGAPSPGHDELLVLPRVEPVVAAAGGGDLAALARRARAQLGVDVDLDGIRPLREGTAASRIYWPALARGAEPQERQLTAGGARLPLLVLDPRGAADRDALDAAVRATASLARALARSGGCDVLLPGDRHPQQLTETLSGWAHLHVRLALLGAVAGPPLASVTGRGGPLLFVSARVRTRLPAALGTAPGATRVLVVPGALAAQRASFTVAGCSGYALAGRAARRPGLRRTA